MTPHQAEFITIPQDDDGPIPELLREILWNRKLSGEKMPKIMYINPTGSNPVGIIVPLERRKEIYSIACEYNFLIVDDDPYHFVHYDKVRTEMLSLCLRWWSSKVLSLTRIVAEEKQVFGVCDNAIRETSVVREEQSRLRLLKFHSNQQDPCFGLTLRNLANPNGELL